MSEAALPQEMTDTDITRAIIGAAIEVHKASVQGYSSPHMKNVLRGSLSFEDCPLKDRSRSR